MPGKVFNLTKGVLSFNGRKGNVIPKDGDYTADQVGAANKEFSNISDYQKAIKNLGCLVRPNLLINGRFKVWQEYPNGYTGVPSNKYVVDGFKILSSNGSIQSSFAKYSNDGGIINQSGPNCRIKQFIENQESYNGKTLTLSALKNENSFYTVTIDVNEWTQDTDIIFAFGNSEISWANSGDIIHAVKLEEGKNQTLCYNENGKWKILPQPDDDYQLQLKKCQYYFMPISGMYSGGTSSDSSSRVITYIPCGLMRTLPSVANMNNSLNAYLIGQEVPSGIKYIGNYAKEVIERGNGYVLAWTTNTTLGIQIAGRIGIDSGYFDARL